MTKTTLFLRGKMETVEPITVTHKGAQRGKTHQLPRAGHFENATPYWPASNIRGALRDAIAAEVAAAAKNNGNPLTMAQYFMYAQGIDADGVMNNDKSESKIGYEAELREQNPAISLLGRWKLQSRMEVGNATPITPDSVAMYGQGARTILFERKPELVQELSTEDQESLQKLMSFQSEASSTRGDIKAQIRDKKAQLKTASDADKKLIQGEIRALEEQDKTITKGEEGVSGLRRPLDGFEAFNANVEFNQKITLNNCSELELGLFMSGLRRFTRSPKLGAKSAHNMGEVRFAWDVMAYDNEEALQPTKIGHLALSMEDGLEVDCPILMDALKKWDVEKKVLDSIQLDKLF